MMKLSVCSGLGSDDASSNSWYSSSSHGKGSSDSCRGDEASDLGSVVDDVGGDSLGGLGVDGGLGDVLHLVVDLGSHLSDNRGCHHLLTDLVDRDDGLVNGVLDSGDRGSSVGGNWGSSVRDSRSSGNSWGSSIRDSWSSGNSRSSGIGDSRGSSIRDSWSSSNSWGSSIGGNSWSSSSIASNSGSSGNICGNRVNRCSRSLDVGGSCGSKSGSSKASVSSSKELSISFSS